MAKHQKQQKSASGTTPFARIGALVLAGLMLFGALATALIYFFA